MSHCYLELYHQPLRQQAKRHLGGMGSVSSAARGRQSQERLQAQVQPPRGLGHSPSGRTTESSPSLACATLTSSHQTEEPVGAAASDQSQPGRRGTGKVGSSLADCCFAPECRPCWASEAVARAAGWCWSSPGSDYFWGSTWSLGESPD